MCVCIRVKYTISLFSNTLFTFTERERPLKRLAELATRAALWGLYHSRFPARPAWSSVRRPFRPPPPRRAPWVPELQSTHITFEKCFWVVPRVVH